MKRKLSFLQYLLKEDKQSMISQVLKATQENPLKNDFVFTCKKYMKILGIEFSFEEIEKMSKASFKKVLKEKTRQAAYRYFIGQNQNNQKMLISNIQNLKCNPIWQRGTEMQGCQN